MIDAGISSTQRIAQFWQIADPQVEILLPQKRERAAAPARPARAEGITRTIEDALRSAGLLR